MADNDDLPLAIATGHRNMGVADNKNTTWGKLVARCKEPFVDSIDAHEYFALPKEEQDKRKNVGWFIAGHVESGIRSRATVAKRSFLTLDVDNGRPSIIQAIENHTTGISDYEFCVYSTRRHTRDKPRFRVLIPLAKPIDVVDYKSLARITAWWLDPSLTQIDHATTNTFSQLMFWPSICKGSDFFWFRNPGKLLDATTTLIDVDIDTVPTPPRGVLPKQLTGRVDPDDPFADDGSPIDITDEKLAETVEKIPNEDAHYDVYLMIGQAIHHQTRGSDAGYDIWKKWASGSTKYSESDLDKRWESFGHDVPGRAMITARTLIHMANESVAEALKEKYAEISARLKAAPSVFALRDIAAEVKKIDFDNFQRDELVRIFRDRYKEITSSAIAPKQVRDLMRHEKQVEIPKWLDGWTFLTVEHRFFNPHEGNNALKPEAFDLRFLDKMLTDTDRLEGRMVPEIRASVFAIATRGVPSVRGRIYMPGHPPLCVFEGQPYSNIWTTTGLPVPVSGPAITSAGRRARQAVDAHFEHLIADERAREIFKSVLGWIIRDPRHRVRWATIIQGTKGDGKTFFYDLIAACIGKRNTVIVTNEMLADKFNSWAADARLVFVEEIKIGRNRYDIMDKLKPLITNYTIPVRRMNTDYTIAPNYGTYLATTNFRDAVPMEVGENRYFVIFSRWQSKDDLDEFIEFAPSYYPRLLESLQEPGALIDYFSNIPLHKDFNPDARAPFSIDAQSMTRAEKGDTTIPMKEIISSGFFGCTRELLLTAILRDKMEAQGLALPGVREIGHLLHELGFTPLGQQRIRHAQYRDSVWTCKPELFTDRTGRVFGQKLRIYWTKMTGEVVPEDSEYDLSDI